MNTKTLFLALIIVTTVIVVGCTQQTPTTNNYQNTIPTETSTSLSASQDLKRFASVDELKTFLSQNTNTALDNSRGGVMYKSADVALTGAQESAPNAPTATTGAGGTGTIDHSQTNVQVQGVDEGDFIKNDEKYIYMIADNKLVIIDAQDGKNSKILSQTSINTSNEYYQGATTAKEIFLNKDKIILFVDKYERSFYFEKYDIKPIETSKQVTVAYIYDVSDRTNPKLLTEYEISGGYFSSRMIGDYVYVVSQENLFNWAYYGGPMIVSAKATIRPEIYYFDNPDQNYQMNTITSLNLNTNGVVDSKSFMLGYGNTLMVSENNIYIAYQNQRYWCWGWRCSGKDTDNEERFKTVVVPLLEGDIKIKVDNILSQGLSTEDEWTKISAEFSNFYKDANNDQTLQNRYEKMFGKIEDALNEYDTRKALEESKTTIHKIAIKDGKIDYQTKGSVEGRLLNQFSLDEYQGNLRVATSTNIWTGKSSEQYNNVFVLDGDMNTIGELKGLAENESIYSTRFVEDKLFMVTFRQIDPFFTIDLSNPQQPKVLGYLKISGYSSYLHPINSTLIIGVGKETGENEFGGVGTKGIKVSLFDVSDFNNPKELDKYEIGLSGTDSPILYDHRAFLYSSTKNILVIPVTEIVDRIKSGQYNYRTKVWNGAYVLSIKDDKFVVDGKVQHSSSETDYYAWFNTASVMRSLYIDNTLYTISNKYVKANDLNNNLDDLNTITLPHSDEIAVPVMY